MKYNVNTKIISNKKIKSSYYKLVLFCKEISSIAQPGQFVSILVSKKYDPLLRRPFSINKIEKNNIHIIYKVVGRGTEILRKKKKDEYLNILGPLGKVISFVPPPSPYYILVGGGYGISPLLFLAEELIKNKISPSSISVLIGAKSKKEILGGEDFKKNKINTVISTEDGTEGIKGKVTDALSDILKNKKAIIYSCGPKEMLKKVHYISKKYNSKCYVLLEEMIACGVGACLGCAVKVKGTQGYSYKMICTDGPVFDSEEILW